MTENSSNSPGLYDRQNLDGWVFFKQVVWKDRQSSQGAEEINQPEKKKKENHMNADFQREIPQGINTF